MMPAHAAPVGLHGAPVLSEHEFRRISTWLFERSGIHLADAKKALVSGRLAARLRHLGLQRFGDYMDLLQAQVDAAECQLALDLLTTNETSFFREPRHFELLRQHILPAHDRGRPFRVWSAACSSGEEPYTVGMVLAEELGADGWEILASDMSARMLERARTAIYSLQRARTLPRPQLLRHCLRGTGRHEGSFQVGPEITRLVRFAQINLNAPLPDLGLFDLVLLRNVMIYFQPRTKREVVLRVAERLRPGGVLMIGHSESLTGMDVPLAPLAPATYRRP